ncbi:hypothetical protein GIB67_020026 [Kingdonia uniflora]|uniref:Uncharacterized protein n=1 Tax=Kingdonia uniflora TaxID=39325 RepID=A0A7J7N4L5_9MAGN|nr:hypothetical protein GIB67_020026 [Kingdonia uniflora]
MAAALDESFLANFDDLLKKKDDVDEDMLDHIEPLSYNDLDDVSKLQRTQPYIETIQKVDDSLHKRSDLLNQELHLEDNPEY